VDFLFAKQVLFIRPNLDDNNLIYASWLYMHQI
jgi:hypothetical protein